MMMMSFICSFRNKNDLSEFTQFEEQSRTRGGQRSGVEDQPQY
jgi:hypothetical protein